MIRLESNKSALYQWDLNMRVILTNVPAGTEVHYSNASYNMDENCITVVSYSENGCVYADIPNKILQTSGVVLAYIYIQDEDKAWTEFETEILVLPRKKPTDYIYTETEIKTFESLEKRIESLESTQDPDAIKNAVKDYIEQNPVEVPVQSVNGQTGEVKLNAEDVGAIAETELHTAINTALAQAKASGEFDGADGYSPAASVEQIADGVKITITDKSGTTEAQVLNGKDGRDGTDGAPGRDGVDGQPGKDGTDGITPTIGDNGNWYLGGTDTGKPSRGADGATGATGATGAQGPAGTDGKSAYQYAVDGGYTGTEEEFAAKMAQEMPTTLPNPNALTFTGAVTGSYDGSAPVTVNIPEGGGGAGDGYSDYEVLIDETITTDEAGISTIIYTELAFSKYNDIVIFFDRKMNKANDNKNLKVQINMLGYPTILNHSIASPVDSYRSSIFRVLNMGNGNVASFACSASNQCYNPMRLDCCGIFPLNESYNAAHDNGFALKLSGAYIGEIKLKILAK